MNDILLFIGFLTIAIAVIYLLFLIFGDSAPTLDFRGHFKPKKHFFFERCSRCGKRLKHYHWFWGKGDFMACDVDYDGNTAWYCKECDEELSKDVIYKIPTDDDC